MTLFLPDANVLIHALRSGTGAHEVCRRWLLETARKGGEIGLCELVEVALLRVPTLERLQLAPIEEVLGFWQDDLWSYSRTRRLHAGSGHNRCLAALIRELGLFGNDVNDAWLAALAIEHRATLVSLDNGFGRFAGLRWLNPASGA